MGTDVFVSYAHADDESPDGSLGIVSKIKKYLTIAGRHKYGRELRFFTDKDLQPGVRWEKELADKIRACRLFMPIVSPSWLNSDVCQHEWNQCWELLKNDFTHGNRTRIVPISFELDGDDFRQLPADQVSLQIVHRFHGEMNDDEFRRVASDLATKISSLLKELDRAAPEKALEKAVPKPAAPRRGRRVFLGFAFSEHMLAWKERVHRELGQRQYEACEFEYNPTHLLDDVNDGIRKCLSDCVAAIHFLDEDAGASPRGARGRSLLEIQCDVAKKHEADGLVQFFWGGPDLDVEKIEDKHYQEFVAALELTNETVGTFVKSLIANLDKLQQAPQADLARDVRARPLICLICESGDKDVCNEIATHLSHVHKWHVSMPNLDVDQRRISDSYARVFRENEYFLFYWGKGGPDWCRNNYEDLLHARRQESGDVRDPLSAAIYFALEKFDYKEKFGWPWLELRQYDRFDPKALQAFVRDVEAWAATKTAVASQSAAS